MRVKGRLWGAGSTARVPGGCAFLGLSCPILAQGGSSLAWDGHEGWGRWGLGFTPLCFFPPSPDDPIRLLREVVLLTDDRNLRVKALTRNVPVRDIPTFLKWAQEG